MAGSSELIGNSASLDTTFLHVRRDGPVTARGGPVRARGPEFTANAGRLRGDLNLKS